jgi:hypothetical protein
MSRKTGTPKITALAKSVKRVPRIDTSLDTISRKLAVDSDFIWQSLFSGYTYDQLKFTKELAIKAHEYFIQMASLNQLHDELKELAGKYFWSFYPARAEEGLELMRQRRPKKNNEMESKTKNARKSVKKDKVAKRGRGRPAGTGNKKNKTGKNVVLKSNRGRRSKSN